MQRLKFSANFKKDTTQLHVFLVNTTTFVIVSNYVSAYKSATIFLFDSHMHNGNAHSKGNIVQIEDVNSGVCNTSRGKDHVCT